MGGSCFSDIPPLCCWTMILCLNQSAELQVWAFPAYITQTDSASTNRRSVSFCACVDKSSSLVLSCRSVCTRVAVMN